MDRRNSVSHSFVACIPEKLEEGVVYVSVEYGTVVHKCCCGCGKEVVTPLSPTDWRLLYDGETISLTPSIGNWNFECKSHYWIIENHVVWSERWSDEEIEEGLELDRRRKCEHYAGKGDRTVRLPSFWFGKRVPREVVENLEEAKRKPHGNAKAPAARPKPLVSKHRK